MTYQCHNRGAFAPSMAVQDGWYMDGYTRTPRMVPMPFRMSKDCEYSTSELGQKDKGCDGCKWKAGAGTGVATGSVQVGDSLAGVCQVEGEPSGDTRPGDVERASASAEQRRHLREAWPTAQLYEPTEEK
jgi:hypothetical protein